MKTHFALFVAGTIVWVLLTRYARWHMGECTLALLVTGWMGLHLRYMYEVWREALPNLYGRKHIRWSHEHILSWMSGGVLVGSLGGLSRLFT